MNPGYSSDDELPIPQDYEAERSIIATVAGSVFAYVDTLTSLAPGAFLAPQHRAIWTALQRLHVAGQEISPITLKIALDEQGELGKVGGFDGLVSVLSADEVGRPAILADRIRTMALRRELMKAAAEAMRLAADPSVSIPDALSGLNQAVYGAGDGLMKSRPPLSLVDTSDWAVEEPPPIRYLLAGLLPLGVPCILAGESNTGKGFIGIQMSMGTAVGRGIFGLKGPDSPMRVLFVEMEDDADELHRRYRRCLDLFRQEPDWTQADEDLLRKNWRPAVPDWTSTESKTLAGMKDFLLREAAELCKDGTDLGLIVLDTFAALSEGEENKAEVQREFWAACFTLSSVSGATPLIVHHVRKPPNVQGKGLGMSERLSFSRLRGSSAIVGGARGIIQVEALTVAEAAKAGLDEERARAGNWVVLALTKLNGGPKGAWIALEQREFGDLGAGFFAPMANGDRICAQLKSKGAVADLSRLENILLDLGEGMDRDRLAEKHWPGDPKAKTKLRNSLADMIRRNRWLQKDRESLTAEGFKRFQELRRQNEDPAIGPEGGGEQWRESA